MLYHQSLEEQKAREISRKEGWKKVEEYVNLLKLQQSTEVLVDKNSDNGGAGVTTH